MKKPKDKKRKLDLDGHFPPGGMNMVTGPSGAKERIRVFTPSGLMSQISPDKFAQDVNSILSDPDHNLILKPGEEDD